jgi:hypothetical protein
MYIGITRNTWNRYPVADLVRRGPWGGRSSILSAGGLPGACRLGDLPYILDRRPIWGVFPVYVDVRVKVVRGPNMTRDSHSAQGMRGAHDTSLVSVEGTTRRFRVDRIIL